MQEIHVVFLYDRELTSVLKHIIVFKATFQADEKLTLHRPELRAEADAEIAVFVAVQTVFVDQAAVPIIPFPEPSGTGFPVIADFAIYLHGIAVGE